MPIRPATHADIPSIAAICAAAFYDDELYGDLMHTRRAQYPQDWQTFWLRKTRESWWNWKHVWWVAVTHDKDIGKEIVVGAAEWDCMGRVRKELGRDLVGWDLSMLDPF